MSYEQAAQEIKKSFDLYQKKKVKVIQWSQKNQAVDDFVLDNIGESIQELSTEELIERLKEGDQHIDEVNIMRTGKDEISPNQITGIGLLIVGGIGTIATLVNTHRKMKNQLSRPLESKTIKDIEAEIEKTRFRI